MLHIRSARAEDASEIYDLIYELAVFEKAPEEFVNTREAIIKDGFGENPAFTCFIAEWDRQVAGMSFCYDRYSTWKGKCLYLEDLIVKESFRRKGIGTALFEHTLKYGRDKGYKRVQWQVLDWNTPAIDFYKRFDAGFTDGWLNSWVDL